MPPHELYTRLKTEIDNIPVVDTHEHLYLPEEDYLKLNADFAQFLFQYNLDDLISAGMNLPNLQEFTDTAGSILSTDSNPLSLDEKWIYIKPYWENAKYTGYGRAVRLSLNKLLGIEDLDDTTYREVSEKLTAFVKPGVYHTILRDICGFMYNLNDIDPMVKPGAFERMDRSLFHFAARFQHFTYAYLQGGIERLETLFNRTIRNIDHLLDTLDSQFERWILEGRLALKLGDAYQRDLFFEDSTRDEAEHVMRRLFTRQFQHRFDDSLSFDEARPLENFILHRVLDRAEEYGFPVIVHTGIQAFFRKTLGNSRAALLSNLFLKYPKINFHLLHSSYPWMYEAACLAKQFPNVTLDLTWVHVIVPRGARDGLSHMLDMVPLNKIHGFGGDYMVPLNIWGALEVARENIAAVLAEKVESGYMSEHTAVEIAYKLLNSNARQIFAFD